MAMELNKVTLIGRCTATMTSKTIESSNTAVINFTIVTNRKYKNASGVLTNEAEYHRCTAYSTNAEVLTKYLTKGKKMYIEWRLKTKKRQSADGIDRYTTEIIVESFIFLDNRTDAKWEELEEDPMTEQDQLEDDIMWINI